MNKTGITGAPCGQRLVIAREFDAPRELVFRAFTDPALYVRRLGPWRLTMSLETFEWPYVHKDADGSEHAFDGVPYEVSPPGGVSPHSSWRGFRILGMSSLRRRASKPYPVAGPG